MKKTTILAIISCSKYNFLRFGLKRRNKVIIQKRINHMILCLKRLILI